MKIITSAARRVLRPMGFLQKGRSRIWRADHGWWLSVVEFQLNGWTQGSYLNVGCMWLWCVKDHISFDEGYRVGAFSEFNDEPQFEGPSNNLVECAAQEVLRYRKSFPNVQAVSNHYRQCLPDGFWPSFSAGTAHALAGRSNLADILFKQVVESDDRRDWAMRAKAEAAELCSAASDASRCRDIVSERVRRCRELHRLPALTSIDFDRHAITL